MTGKIPKFKKKEDIAEFWDSHDFTDFVKDTEECDDTFVRPILKPTSLRLDPLMLKKIKALARKKGLAYNAYIRILLAKAFNEEIEELLRPLKSVS